VLNELGAIAREEWLRTGQVRKEIELNTFVIMPNHIHGIIGIKERVQTSGAPMPAKISALPSGTEAGTIGAIMAQYKSIVTKRVNKVRGMPAAKVWHRNYFEHVIRDEEELQRIRSYIENNPRNWGRDKFNPESKRKK